MGGRCAAAGLAALAVAMAWCGPGGAADLAPQGAGGADACGAVADSAWAAEGLTTALVRTRDALATSRPLTVVALGSSSTEGVGASAPSKTYPAQLQAMLGARTGGTTVAVLNKGRGGETAAANLARLDADVLAARPDLVVWQIGTNDGFQRVPVAEFVTVVRDGAARIRAAGAELVLMNPQYFPGEASVDSYAAYVAAVAELGRELGVPVVDRHRMMKGWLASGRFTVDSMLSPDGYHLRDPSYHCLAVAVADLLAPAAVRQHAADAR